MNLAEIPLPSWEQWERWLTAGLLLSFIVPLRVEQMRHYGRPKMTDSRAIAVMLFGMVVVVTFPPAALAVFLGYAKMAVVARSERLAKQRSHSRQPGKD